VRPVEHISHLALYWDDSNIPDHTVPPSEGCNGSLGCHKFGYFFGDSSTINTWWYAISDRVDSMVLFTDGLVMEDAVVSNQTCSNRMDGSIEIFGSGGDPPYLYALNDGPFRETSLFSGLEQGAYTVRIRDVNQCVRERAVNLGLNTTILADFDFREAEAYNRILFDFTGMGANSYFWDFDDGSTGNMASSLHQFNTDTTFYVSLLVESGPPDFCADSVTKAIEIYPGLQLYVPNAFSPNGDNLNDEFRILGVAIHRFEIYIFSADGTQLFYSNNLENSWDGTWNGELLNRGVYAYLIRAYDRMGKLHEKKGTVTLVR
ncbi:MAG: gliding motility-associated C-terminal domain-containing protein, partial [bacterium]